jgi:hypothetical protein
MRYLDPKNDLTFKRVFAEHPHLLISFLNNILPLEEGRKIEHIEYLPAELIPEIPLFKYTIVDVRCLDNFGRQFIVEMQMLWTDSFKNRVLFNASKAYIKQLEKGEHFESLQPVYALSLVNHNFENEMDAYFIRVSYTKRSLLLMCFLHNHHCSCDTPPCARLATRPADTPRCSTARDCTRDTRAGPALSCTRRTSCCLSCLSPQLLSSWSRSCSPCPLSLPPLSWSGDCAGGRRRAW